ncbi:uncharacterized protein LOC144462448 isoform X1 [Epinephelus lanceolatus]
MRTLHVLMFCCFSAPTVLLGAPPSTTTTTITTTLQTEADTLPQGSFAFTTERSAADSTLPVTEGRKKEAEATSLKDTTVVIIVSVSLALLVCAFIPLIFFTHCRSNVEGHNKGESDYCEENADGASQGAVRLQSLNPHVDAESSGHDASQYAAIYKALDPKTLE